MTNAIDNVVARVCRSESRVAEKVVSTSDTTGLVTGCDCGACVAEVGKLSILCVVGW